ncbi:DUF5330 domain-containing protein [Rhizobium tumorigenes]|uniref:DUF5330 domain-containing protein n=1 Tax=Rhizobium tumorigenes TaxID=2041385 RepID=A0AAF1KRG9_9HYPH|nr:DUF5330 domain-containing protein [Rhizobium tumorigenes]WFR96203.1 DUF5330 domain-containing protein [Rhizobium tumorigenes]
MWFLIKTAFWFSLVLVLLPVFSSQSTNRTQNNPQVQMSDAVTAATGAFQYVTSLCSEKPEICVKGGETFTALGYRAREGALVAYEMIDHQLSGKPADKTASNAGAPDASRQQVAVAAPQAEPDMQPMPPKPGSDASDSVFTGTIIHVPVPMRRPVL